MQTSADTYLQIHISANDRANDSANYSVNDRTIDSNDSNSLMEMTIMISNLQSVAIDINGSYAQTSAIKPRMLNQTDKKYNIGCSKVKDRTGYL